MMVVCVASVGRNGYLALIGWCQLKKTSGRIAESRRNEESHQDDHNVVSEQSSASEWNAASVSIVVVWLGVALASIVPNSVARAFDG